MKEVEFGILDKDEYEELIRELEIKCINSEDVGFTVLKDGTALSCIRIDKRLFKKLVQAGSIDVTSRITTLNLYPHFYVKLEIQWPTIKEKRSLMFNGVRDKNFLQHLCNAKRLALTAFANDVVVVDGLDTKQLKFVLVITSMMYHAR